MTTRFACTSRTCKTLQAVHVWSAIIVTVNFKNSCYVEENIAVLFKHWETLRIKIERTDNWEIIYVIKEGEY